MMLVTNNTQPVHGTNGETDTCPRLLHKVAVRAEIQALSAKLARMSDGDSGDVIAEWQDTLRRLEESQREYAGLSRRIA